MNILEALRTAVDELDSYETDLLLNAANEIESLQAENDELQKENKIERNLRIGVEHRFDCANEELGRLKAQIEQLQRENQSLRMQLADTEALELGTAERLAASQAREAKLREALEEIKENAVDPYGDGWCGAVAQEALRDEVTK